MRRPTEVSSELQELLDELDEYTREFDPGSVVVRYAQHQNCVGDLRVSNESGPRPLAIVIHGGFNALTRTYTAPLAIALTRAGIATWNISYRHSFEQTLDDLRAAVAYSSQLPDDTVGQPVVIGHSAGGWMALWLAASEFVSGVVGLAPVCDLEAMARGGIGAGAAQWWLGGEPDDCPDVYSSARLPLLSPQVPRLLVHGSADENVPISQSQSYVRRATEAGKPVELMELDGVAHFELIDPRSEAGANAIEQIDRFTRACSLASQSAQAHSTRSPVDA
jgi:acetyl esterase/lipase